MYMHVYIYTYTDMHTYTHAQTEVLERLLFTKGDRHRLLNLSTQTTIDSAVYVK